MGIKMRTQYTGSYRAAPLLLLLSRIPTMAHTLEERAAGMSLLTPDSTDDPGLGLALRIQARHFPSDRGPPPASPRAGIGCLGLLHRQSTRCGSGHGRHDEIKGDRAYRESIGIRNERQIMHPGW